MRFDIHVHTTLSGCSQLTVGQLLEGAVAQGLDGVCITDHDTMAIANHIREGVQANGLCLLFGMEYSTAQGDFLIFGPFEEVAVNLSAPELLSHVAQAGGVAVAAHPFRPGRSSAEEIFADGLCPIVEGVNGRNRDVDNQRAMSLQEQYGTHLAGGSDAHSLSELGLASTIFAVEIKNRADLISALKSGCYSPERASLPFALCA
ncbi:MAG: PHP domain-containing protein [Thermodesulfobacteriota bacterium]